MKNGLKIIALLLLLSLLTAVLAIGASAASVTEENPTTGEEITVEDSGFFALSEPGARALLIIFASLFGLLLPIAPITVFTLKLFKKRSEFEVVDYIILGISVIWLASGALIFAMVL